MTCCLMYRSAPSGTPERYYRIELSMTLFEEVALCREWGEAGRNGGRSIRTFDNLRHASEAADAARQRAARRGYAPQRLN